MCIISEQFDCNTGRNVIRNVVKRNRTKHPTFGHTASDITVTNDSTTRFYSFLLDETVSALYAVCFRLEWNSSYHEIK